LPVFWLPGPAAFDGVFGHAKSCQVPAGIPRFFWLIRAFPFMVFLGARPRVPGARKLANFIASLSWFFSRIGRFWVIRHGSFHGVFGSFPAPPAAPIIADFSGIFGRVFPDYCQLFGGLRAPFDC
jgi:hypothetical protein